MGPRPMPAFLARRLETYFAHKLLAMAEAEEKKAEPTPEEMENA